jgi:hypothetical protein
MTSIGTSRNRLWLLVCVVAVIALGLASRKFPSLFPAIFGKYPGDALWALMVFVGLAFVKPRASTAHLAVLAFAFACAIELSQLYQRPWLNEIRGTTIGHLVLGSTFSWPDIAAYAVGVLVGSLIDSLSESLRSNRRPIRLLPPTRRRRHSFRPRGGADLP